MAVHDSTKPWSEDHLSQVNNTSSVASTVVTYITLDILYRTLLYDVSYLLIYSVKCLEFYDIIQSILICIIVSNMNMMSEIIMTRESDIFL